MSKIDECWVAVDFNNVFLFDYIDEENGSGKFTVVVRESKEKIQDVINSVKKQYGMVGFIPYKLNQPNRGI